MVTSDDSPVSARAPFDHAGVVCAGVGRAAGFSSGPRAAAGIRTQDLLLTKEVLYQLSYSSDDTGSPANGSTSHTRGDGHRPERAMGFEPTTSCLEGKSSTTELHPRGERINAQG